MHVFSLDERRIIIQESRDVSPTPRCRLWPIPHQSGTAAQARIKPKAAGNHRRGSGAIGIAVAMSTTRGGRFPKRGSKRANGPRGMRRLRDVRLRSPDTGGHVDGGPDSDVLTHSPLLERKHP
jgi:hypothetical protein